MYEFILPDYSGNSIINLMSSISRGFDNPHSYNELSLMGVAELRDFGTVVLIVIDGLGYNYLRDRDDSFLWKYCRGPVTSTFLSTTACANTAFSVGYPPQQHALTGWDINLKEVGAITTILPFIPMYGGDELSRAGFRMEDIMDIPSFRRGFQGRCFTLIDEKLAGSPFTGYVSRDSEMIPVAGFEYAFLRLRELVGRPSAERRYIHLYLPQMDSAAHKEGLNSDRVLAIFWELNDLIKDLSESLEGTNTRVIVTGDHGLVDVTPETVVRAGEIEGLKECLTIPLAGESRVRDCFVRPRKVDAFERIVADRLSEYCWCYRGEQLINDNLYGLGEPNRKLFDRVGDYVLIMKEKYILLDPLANDGRREVFLIGRHGGVSEDEMLVPLIILDC